MNHTPRAIFCGGPLSAGNAAGMKSNSATRTICRLSRFTSTPVISFSKYHFRAKRKPGAMPGFSFILLRAA